MQKHLLAPLGASFVLAIAAPLFAAPETITGEVISLSCYTNDKTEIGRKGYTCALATIKWEGNPAGILTSDGKVYQIAGGLTANNNEKLWALIGHTVTITGEVTQTPGFTPTLTAADAKDISPPSKDGHDKENAMDRAPITHLARAIGAIIVLLAITADLALTRTIDSAYREVENWAQLPPGYAWGTMSAVAVDAKGNVYAFQRDDPTSKVIVFDKQGKYLKTWGEGTFPYPHGMRALRDGNIWTTDRQAQVVLKFDPDGKLLLSLGQKGVAGTMESTDTFNGASDVAMADNGDIFVSDGEGQNTRVVKFSKDGKFIKTWGTKGAGPGQMQTPHAIFIDGKGRVWVADRGNKRLQIFDQDGKFLDQMTQFGTPVSLFIQGDTLYVAAPAPENKVTIGTTDGKVLDVIEGLDAPHGIAVDASGAIYVAQSGGKSILKFVKK